MNDVGRTAELAGVVQRLRQVSYVDVAALTYNIVDYAQTFEWEVKHMWGGKPSMIKLVYFVGRYLGAIDVPLMFIYSHHFGKLTPTQCTLLYTFGGTSALTGASAAEVLMFLRVWVLSGCTKKMGWYLTAQFTVIMASVTVLAGLYLKSLAYTTSPLPDQISCHQLTADRFMLALMYGFVLIHQVVVMMLCLYFGVATFRHSRSPLLHILYRDGTFYFAILSVVSIANISVITVGPPEYQNLFLLLQRTIHSTLATRTILKMREMASRNQYSATTIAAGRPHGLEGEILHPGGHQNQTMSALKFRAQQWISEGLVTQAFPGGMLPSVYEGEEGREDHSSTYPTRQEDEASTQNLQL